MSENQVICAVDVGSTFIKATLRDGVDNVLARSTLPYPQDTVEGDLRGHNALWIAFTSVINEISANQKPDAIIISCQMAGLSMVGHDGLSIGPLIPGVDMRFPKTSMVDVSPSGCGDEAVSTVAKLLWFAEESPNFNISQVRIGGIKEFLLQKLTGRWVTDPASASSMGFYSIARQDWSAQTLKATKIEVGQLPDIEVMGEIIGGVLESAAESCGVPAGTPVFCGLGDGPAANISSGALGSDILCLSRGTTVVARILFSGTIPDLGSLPFFTQHLQQSWKCVGVRLTVDPSTGFFVLPGSDTAKIPPEGIGQYLQPMIDAFHVREVRPAGGRDIPLPTHWSVHEVPVDAQDGTRGMALVAGGWKLEQGRNLFLDKPTGADVY